MYVRVLRCFLFPGDVGGAKGRSQGEISEGRLHGGSEGVDAVLGYRTCMNRVTLLDIVYLVYDIISNMVIVLDTVYQVCMKSYRILLYSSVVYLIYDILSNMVVVLDIVCV